MSNINNIAVLLHAYNLDSGFSSTKTSNVFKIFSEHCTSSEYSIETIRNEVMAFLGLPSDKSWQQALEEIRIAVETGIYVVTFLDQNYPSELRHIPDPPLVLFITAKMNIDSTFWQSFDRISIVGSRSTSQYGVMTGISLAKKLTHAGNSIVSGLAYGIDKAAHEGALRAVSESIQHPCPTIAVLGSGLLELYPKSHAPLAQEIIEAGGLVLSEYGLYLRPRTYLFPRRNRIVSGLSGSIVIVEAKKKSGSLITARLALEQNKELFCVPGPIDSELSEGVNELIREGAGVISSIDDFVESKISKKYVNFQMPVLEVANVERNFSLIQKKICKALKTHGLSFDELLELKILEEEELRLELYNLEMQDVLTLIDGCYRLI